MLTEPPPRNWFARNWKWLVPTGCLTILGLIAVFIGVVVLIAFSALKSSDAYAQAVARAKADPRVVAALGMPIKEAMFPSGKTNVAGGSGEADLSIPIYGPKATAIIYAVAQKSGGTWTYSKLSVRVAEVSAEIDLLKPVANTL